MEGVRMLSVLLVEYDSRKLGGNTLLIPFEETWLATNSCCELLQCVLTSHLELPELLSTVEQVKMFCVKQKEFVQAGSSSKKEIANAIACIDYKAIFVIESFSTQSFQFKLVSQPTIHHVASSRAHVNPFSLMMNAQANYVFLPTLLKHDRMHSNHDLYNELIEFLRKHNLGWTLETVSTLGKRFVDGMSRALFQCGPLVWKALNYDAVRCFFF
jgi:hypothetical protein